MTEAAEGRKDDTGKLRWSLLPWGATSDVVAVLEYGARKYSPGNWLRVPDARRRYFDAAMRHLIAWWAGEQLDPETGLSHLSHASCSLLFLRALEREDETRAQLGLDDPVVHDSLRGSR